MVVAALGSAGAASLGSPTPCERRERGARVTYGRPLACRQRRPRSRRGPRVKPFTPDPSGPSGRDPPATVTITTQGSMRGGAGRIGTRSGLDAGGAAPHILVRHGLIEPRSRRRRRRDYIRWQRQSPMQLWQLDIVGGVLLTDGTECKVVTGVDDHSRFCVIATVVARATGRAVCLAFAEALRRYGVPDEVLTDNGKGVHRPVRQGR